MDGSPTFLSVAEVLEIHADQIARYGGSEGLRDWNLLDSAVAQPQVTFGGAFLHQDLFEMAAAYLYHLTQNHPFIDGNKRVGAAAALVFLDLNGVEIQVDDEALVDLVLKVAQGQLQTAQIADFFRQHQGP